MFSHSVMFHSLWLLGLAGSSVHGNFQPRILEWVAISTSRGSSWPRDLNPHLLWLLHYRWILCCWATRWAMKMRSWQAEKQAVVCTNSNAQTMQYTLGVYWQERGEPIKSQNGTDHTPIHHPNEFYLRPKLGPKSFIFRSDTVKLPQMSLRLLSTPNRCAPYTRQQTHPVRFSS